MPRAGLTAFHCPHCHVLAMQRWFDVHGSHLGKVTQADIASIVVAQISTTTHRKFLNTLVGVCDHCGSPTIWVGHQMVWPRVGSAPPPNADLKGPVREDYLEASAILAHSPRGAAALLRLALQKLCIELGQPGKNLYDDIGALVGQGLPTIVQQALDSVRIVGNNAVHPGTINIDDDQDTARALFGMINLVAAHFLTDRKRVEDFYQGLPEHLRDAIDRRDKAER